MPWIVIIIVCAFGFFLAGGCSSSDNSTIETEDGTTYAALGLVWRGFEPSDQRLICRYYRQNPSTAVAEIQEGADGSLNTAEVHQFLTDRC